MHDAAEDLRHTKTLAKSGRPRRLAAATPCDAESRHQKCNPALNATNNAVVPGPFGGRFRRSPSDFDHGLDVRGSPADRAAPRTSRTAGRRSLSWT